MHLCRKAPGPLQAGLKLICAVCSALSTAAGSGHQALLQTLPPLLTCCTTWHFAPEVEHPSSKHLNMLSWHFRFFPWPCTQFKHLFSWHYLYLPRAPVASSIRDVLSLLQGEELQTWLLGSRRQQC